MAHVVRMVRLDTQWSLRWFLFLSLSMSVCMPLQAMESHSNFRVLPTQGYGIEQHELDHKTRVTGWKVARNWYFGRQRGDDSGLTLVWQRKKNQLSVSKDGIRVTRRF